MRSTARNIPIRIAFSLLKNFSIWLLDGSELGAKNISPSKEITIQISSGEA